MRPPTDHRRVDRAVLTRAAQPRWGASTGGESRGTFTSSRDSSLPISKQALSPSDFGFHNILRGNNGELTFVDFDYFGWDDPVKITADFIWHPAMKLDSEIIDEWKKAMHDLFSTDSNFADRFIAAMPMYGLRWVMILLNEYLPGFSERRKRAGGTETYNINKSREIQLHKAERYCGRVKTMISQVTFT